MKNINKDTNTKKDIIERFQSFDFDPQQINQNRIYNTITDPAAAKKKPKRFRFIFAAAVSVVALVIVIGGDLHKKDRIMTESVKSDLEIYNAPQSAENIIIQEEIAVQKIRNNETSEFAYRAEETERKKEKETITVNVVAVEAGKEVSLDNAYIWLDNKLAGKTNEKGSWTKNVDQGKIRGKVVVKDYEEAKFENDTAAIKDGIIKVVVEPLPLAANMVREVKSEESEAAARRRPLSANAPRFANSAERHSRAKSAGDIAKLSGVSYSRSEVSKSDKMSLGEKEQALKSEYAKLEKQEIAAAERLAVYQDLKRMKALSSDKEYEATFELNKVKAEKAAVSKELNDYRAERKNAETSQLLKKKYAELEEEESISVKKMKVYQDLIDMKAISAPHDKMFEAKYELNKIKEEKEAINRQIKALEDDYNAMKDESYKKYEENSFSSTVSDPLSTFSADVDNASYNIVRQVIMSGRNPDPDSVRIEEFLNYFDYSYPRPEGADPVSMNFEYTDSPWNKGLKLVKIGVKARDIEKASLPPSNLVFLIDVSGSMSQENRLPLVKRSMKMLVNELRPADKVSIVTYANGVNEILSGAKGSEKELINGTIDRLYAGGGTNGSDGLRVAYETAKKNYIRKGNNRIILATDGDFNIGPRSESELENQITEARDSGVFLSVLGYGMGNYKDSKMQTIANKGNGNYAYINDLFEANKVLVKEFGATLFTVAKDVKLQVEFNPAVVSAYRLIGYEKRALSTQDFNDDKKDAGEMGAGHTVTAIYEIIPTGIKSGFAPDVEALKYTKAASSSANDDVLTLKLRYKEPASDTSKLMERSLKQNKYVPFDQASNDMRFAASVAQFGQILKDSAYKGSMTMDEVIKTAKKSKGADEEGYRADFVKMLEMYEINKKNINEDRQSQYTQNQYIQVCPHCGYINKVPEGQRLKFCINCAKTL